MKVTLKISILLNLVSLGGLIFLLTNRHQKGPALLPEKSKTEAPAKTFASSPAAASSREHPSAFRWSQLETAKSYRAYIANLRAIGCPEPTIEDIVRGDVERTFAWERAQLGLDDSEAGRWSRQAGRQLAASLLSGQRPGAGTTTVAQGAGNQMAGNGSDEAAGTAVFAQNAGDQTEGNADGEIAQASVPSPGAKTASPTHPFFHRNMNWDSSGFIAGQPAAISQVAQQYPNKDVAATSAPSGTAIPSLGSEDPNLNSAPNSSSQDPFTISAQDRMRNDLLKYYRWYQPQVIAAAASGQPLLINPDAYSSK